MKIYLVLLACALAVVALAADATGKWTFETQGRNGAVTNTMTLKASGSALSGTLDGGRGGPVEISNGKVDGDNISFEVTREFNGNSFTTKYTGKVAGESIELTIAGPRGEPRTVTAKKST
ncbi:MAG: hypothetical protein LAP38_07100 [Acidobacteriia bacterium]|nr:hypothetical protein [Terriglobia bacterium]